MKRIMIIMLSAMLAAFFWSGCADTETLQQPDDTGSTVNTPEVTQKGDSSDEEIDFDALKPLWSVLPEVLACENVETFDSQPNDFFVDAFLYVVLRDGLYSPSIVDTDEQMEVASMELSTETMTTLYSAYFANGSFVGVPYGVFTTEGDGTYIYQFGDMGDQSFQGELKSYTKGDNEDLNVILSTWCVVDGEKEEGSDKELAVTLQKNPDGYFGYKIVSVEIEN